MKPAQAYADLIALIMWAPRTRLELIEITEVLWKTTDMRIKALHQQGVIYICGWKRRVLGAPWGAVYAMQSKPFERTDAPKPASRAHALGLVSGKVEK